MGVRRSACHRPGIDNLYSPYNNNDDDDENEKNNLTRMWANAQPDGRPAEHRWRLLFNAAKFG